MTQANRYRWRTATALAAPSESRTIAEGSRRTRAEAAETIRLARDAMGMNYFGSAQLHAAEAR